MGKDSLPRTNRRRFIAGAIAALGLSAGGWWLLRRPQEQMAQLRDDPATRLVADILQRRLSFLQLDPSGLAKFARDIEVRGQKTLLRRAGQGDASAQDRLGELFLLSSNFFVHGADENRTVMYLSYYDPYEKPCSNPFAQLA